MKQQFNIGDQVRIVDLRRLDEDRVPFGICPDMHNYIGRITTIRYVTQNSYSQRDHRMPCDGCRYELVDIPWTWSNPMLEKVSSNNFTSAKKDEEVIIYFKK